MSQEEQILFASNDFGLDRRLTKAVANLGYVYATLVQVHSIPLALQGKDLLVRARTGAGKTIAFALPVLQKVLNNETQKKSIKALVLVPTKELVAQTKATFESLMYFCKDVVSVLSLSDESLSCQQAYLRDIPDILITTPSRLMSHIDAGNVELKESVETLVIDEADLVLSFGYEQDIRTIFTHLPKACQSFFMSATLSPELSQLKRSVLHNPAVIKLEEAKSDGQLQQFYVETKKEDKDVLLYALLKLGILQGKVLFFTNSVESAYRLKLFFEQFSTKAAVLNGELPYNSRIHIIQEFNRGVIDYLIATDNSVDKDTNEEEEEAESDATSDEENEDAAEVVDESDSEDEEKPQKKKKKSEYGVSRGIDFRGVTFVVNVDFPKSVKSYTHRIGRTARGGASGTALSIVSIGNEEEAERLVKIQRAQNPVLSNPIDGTQQKLQSEKQDEVVLQPAPLAFDMKEIDCFRYRVEDVRRAVTRIGVKEARLQDVKKEILNSEKLKAHFVDNPRDQNVLAHDKTIGTARVQPHLANIPSYLVPEALLPAPKPESKRKFRKHDKKKKQDDPLVTFQYQETGETTANRTRWQEEHRRGQWNPKNPKSKRFKKSH